MDLPPIVGRLVGDTSQFDRAMRGASDSTGALGKGLGGVKGAIGAVGGAFAAVKVGGFFKNAIMGASDLNETLSKVGTVFGESQKQVSGFADKMAKDFGLPKQEILDAAASIGLVGKASGLSQSDAAKMSTELGKMAADASSFYNVPLPEALQAIQSGLVGEAEPMRRFGVLLSENAVKEKAYAMGVAARGAELTEAQKVQARSTLIMEGMTDASGDLERTQGSLSNRIREMKGRFENLTTGVASAAVPALLKLMDVGENLGKRFGPAIKSIGQDVLANIREAWPRIQQIITDVVGAVVGFVQQHWPRIKEIISEAMETAKSVITNVTTIIRTIWENFGSQIVNILKSAWDFVTDIVDAAMNIIRGIIDVVTGIIKGDWGQVWEGIKSILSGVWDAMKAVISTAIDVIKEVIKVGWDLVKGIFTGTWDAIKTVLSGAWDGIKTIVREGVAYIVDKMLAMAEWVIKAADNAFGWIPFIGPKLDQAARGFEQFRNDVNAALRGIIDRDVQVRAFVTTFFQGGGSITGANSLYGDISQFDPAFRASGGPVRAGNAYIVGERGPELLTMGGSGYVHANGSWGGGGTVVNNFNIYVAGSVTSENDLVDKIRGGLQRRGTQVGEANLFRDLSS